MRDLAQYPAHLCAAEVAQLKLMVFSVHKQVLWLDISMTDAILVYVP